MIVDFTTKMRALSLLAKHLKRTARSIHFTSHVGVANGDHIIIVDGNLYRIDLNTDKVTKV